MGNAINGVCKTDIPLHSALHGKLQKRGYQDAFEFNLSDHALTPQQVYLHIFGRLPKAVEVLMALRNRIVKHFGFATSVENTELKMEDLQPGKGQGLHKVELLTPNEIICTSHDKHLQVSISVYKQQNDHFVLSTLVNTHTVLGYGYLLAIIPFHRVIAANSIRFMLKRLSAADDK